MELLADTLRAAAGLFGVLRELVEYKSSKRREREGHAEARRPRHLRK